MSMRIRGAKTELEEAGLETDGMVESTAKLRQEIMALSDIDIMEADGQTFKSTYDILDELAKKWKDLSDIQQATITELIAGKRQGNVVSSLMNNFQTARDALETSINSSGSAMAEHEKWSKSIEAHLLRLKAAWQSLSQSFLKSYFLKGLLKGVASFTDGFSKIIDKLGTLPTLLGAFAGIRSLFSNRGLFKLDKENQSIQMLGTNISNLGKKYSSVSTKIAKYNSLNTKHQMQFCNSMKNSNTAFGKYISGLNGGKASMAGYVASLVGAKVKTIALQAATMALNMALTMGISLIISGIISAITKWINRNKELAEQVDDLTTKFKEQHDELKKLQGDYDTTNEDSMVSRYKKLSKGVDELGRNVSLTADEYSEYQSIVNKIADQIPSLISGYDSQGNAILSCKDNVKELINEYEKLIHVQNQEILTNAGKIEEDYANTIKKQSGKHWWSNGHGFWAGLVGGIDGILGTHVASSFNYELKDDTVENLEKLLSASEKDKDAIYASLQMDAASTNELIDALNNTGIEANIYNVYDVLKETLKTDPTKIKGIVDNYYSQFSDEITEQKTIALAKLSEAFDISGDISGLDYENISEELQALAYQVVNGLDKNFFDNLQESGKTVEQWTTEMLDQLKSISQEDVEDIEAAFDLKTKFNGGEISYGEYVHGLEDVGNLIGDLGLDKELESQLKLSIGMNEVDGKWVIEEYEALLTRLTSEEYGIQMKTEEAEKFLDELSASEYAVAIDLVEDEDVDFSNFNSIKKLRAYIEKQAKINEAMNFTIAINVETESIESLNAAMAESVSGAGLSSESIAALKSRYAELEDEGYNLSAMFEETANGIHLNRKAVSELEQKLASDKLAETDKQLGVLKDRYDELTTEIDKCRDAGDRASLYTEQQSIVDKINDLATLAAQYEGLTSAYNAWQSAEAAGSERDMYEGIISGFETVEDEIKRGWFDDGSIEFLELLTGKTDLAGKSGKELKEIYDSLDDTIKNTTYSVRDFFTVDEDGNSTNTGVYNFLDAIGQLEEEKFGGKDVVKRDDNGNVIGFDFELVAKKDENGNVIKNGDQVIADALGISEELVQIMIRASDDAGFVVNLEGAYTQLADLKTEAESARDTLISLQKNGLEKLKGVDVNFSLDAEGNDLVAEQEKAVKLLDKFKKDGKIDLTMEGAQQALDIAEYLTIKLDDLTEPKFMQIDTSEVEEDLRDPIEKIQEIGKLCKEKHLVTLTGDTEELKEVQGEIDKVAEEIEELDPEVKAQIGIDENWDAKTIADKIEKGEIEIPAELELDVQMSDDLKDMRLMMMNQLGLVSDNEVKLKIGFDIDNSIVDGLTDEQQEVVVKYLAEHKEVDDYTPEQKEALVKYIADGGNLDDYTPEEKQGIVKYLADGGNIDDYTPQQKQAIVEYLTDSGDPDSWTPEQKEAIAKFKKDSSEVDNYTPEEKQAIAKFIKNSIEPDTYQPPNKTQEVVAKLDSSEPDNYKPKDKKFTVKAILQKIGDWTNKLLSGGSKRQMVNGTANADGTAFATGTINKSGRALKRGDWGVKKTEEALVGELGQELVVYKNRYWTVGDSGAEFSTIPKGAIVFNHRQTEELFANGKVTSGGGRAKAFVEGTAFSGGSGGGLTVDDLRKEKASIKSVERAAKAAEQAAKKAKEAAKEASGSSSEKEGLGKVVGKKAGTSTSASTSSENEKTEETFDFVETAISRIEREIDNLDKRANNVYKSWSERNKDLKNEISTVGDEIKLQQSAYDKYMKDANSVGLSESWAKKIRDGSIDIETITDEDLADKVGKYQDYYEKALACKDAIEELKQKEAELYAQRVENVAAKYDGILGVIEHEKNMLDEYISQSEAQGWLASAKYYDALISNEKDTIAQLKKQKNEMLSELQAGMQSGKIKKGTQGWYELVNSIDEVTLSIAQSETQLKEYQQTVQQLKWEQFDLLQEKISAITEEADFLIELLSSNKLFDDNGKLTDEGMATMGMHGVAYNTYMHQADQAAKEAERIKKELAKDPYDTELEARYREMIALQQEHILAAEGEKEAIRDLVSEGIEAELDSLQELIDKKNEALESERDLYEYQKKVKEQAEEIAALEKQMAAYENDDSEETKAKLQQIKVDLEAARQELEETETDRLIESTEKLLDELYLDYEEILNMRLDNIDALIADVIAQINADASSISSTLTQAAADVGYNLSDSMSNIWDANSTKINSVITTYGDRFSSAQTTTNAVLGNIKSDMSTMISQLNKIANTNAKSASNSSAANSKQANTKKKELKKESEKEETKNQTKEIKVGGKINAAGALIYDYAGDTSGERQLYRNDPIYTVISEKNGYILTRHHKLSSGYSGWFKKSDVKALATGARRIGSNDVAWTQEKGQEFIVRPSDGAILTPVAKGDSVLNANASNNIWNMANSPAEFIKDNLKLDAVSIPNVSSVNNSITQNFENITFSMPNVHGYNDLLTEMQRDPKFEKLILAMTVDRIAGRSSLAKGKAIR